MRLLSIPVLTSALLASAAVLAGPALAQSSTKTPSNSQTGSQSASQKSPAEMQHELQQSLEKSGFKNIKIRPEAYVVHAQAADGSHLVMMISPDEVEGMVIPQSGSSAQPGGGSSSGSTGNQSGSAGSSEKSSSGKQ